VTPLSGLYQAIAVSEALVGFGILVPSHDCKITRAWFCTLPTEGGARRIDLVRV
jgi:hypothetical protein